MAGLLGREAGRWNREMISGCIFFTFLMNFASSAFAYEYFLVVFADLCNNPKLLRLKLKDYPHLMMELFEVAAGNWCVVDVAVVVSRIEKRISQWQFNVLSNTMTNEWSTPLLWKILSSTYPFRVIEYTADFGSNLTLNNWFILDQVWWSFPSKTLCYTIVYLKPTWDIFLVSHAN